MKIAAAVLFSVLLALTRCTVKVRDDRVAVKINSGLAAWTPRAMDTGLPPASTNWSITPSEEIMRDGASTLKFDMDNFSDGGKIWIEKAYTVEANRTYRVTLEYAFASADSGDGDAFRIIAGALPKSPVTGDDLTPALQGTTANGARSDVGYRWLQKSYRFTTQADASGQLCVVIGILAARPDHRTYFLEDVHLAIEEL